MRPKAMRRSDRRVHRDRTRPGRVFRLKPDEALPFVVELRIARDRRRMREAMDFHDGTKAADAIERDCMGLVRTWHSPRLRLAGITRPRMLVARIYLNERDLRDRPSEIVAHEATHAGMGWARLRRAQLGHMPGEEVLCHAVGVLVKQINRACYAHRVWP